MELNFKSYYLQVGMESIMKKEIIEALGALKSVSNYDGKPNQFLIEFKHGRIFQSYESIIVVEMYYRDESELSNKVFFGSNWNYSTTTSKYRNKFLDRNSKWCKDMVDSKKILVLDF